MSCCGNKRAAAATWGGAVNGSREQAGHRRTGVAYFQYVGQTGLTVAGPISGSRYRFDSRGAIVAVDLRDRPALAAIRQLRQVAGP